MENHQLFLFIILAMGIILAFLALAPSASAVGGIVKAEFYIDGHLKDVNANSNPQEGVTFEGAYDWKNLTETNGWHTITVKAYDKAGNSYYDSIAVRVDNR